MTPENATMFLEPVEWPNPVVKSWEGREQMWGNGARASVFADLFRSEQLHKYTRGSCDAHAIASIEEHGGKLLSLMHRGRVAHVLSLHETEDHMFTRDVTGDMAWPEDWEFTPEDFRDLSEKHLLDIEIDDILIVDVAPWALPCRPTPREDIDEARLLQTVLLPIGDRCPEPDYGSDDEEFGPAP